MKNLERPIMAIGISYEHMVAILEICWLESHGTILFTGNRCLNEIPTDAK